jgi:hypothetical protein
VATISVVTVDPQRAFSVDLTADSVRFSPETAPESPAVELPAEAFVRLVYGRLDPDHTPDGHDAPTLGILRRVFPGPCHS